MRKSIGFGCHGMWPRYGISVVVETAYGEYRERKIASVDVPSSTAPIRDTWHRGTALGLWHDLIVESRSRNECFYGFGASLRTLRSDLVSSSSS
jgi:hypothetical protein